jgi:hypothetical protein
MPRRCPGPSLPRSCAATAQGRRPHRPALAKLQS